MEDSTARSDGVTAMSNLLEVIRGAIEASSRFEEENAVGSYRNCMTLFVSAGDGLELTVSVTNPEQLDG
jgi:hypothetical protein